MTIQRLSLSGPGVLLLLGTLATDPAIASAPEVGVLERAESEAGRSASEAEEEEGEGEAQEEEGEGGETGSEADGQASEDGGGEEADDPLSRFKFGGAIGFSADLSSGTPVSEASVVNGIVRVSQSSAAKPRVLLEVHRPFVTIGKKERTILAHTDDSSPPRAVAVRTAGWGIGPFAAVQSGGTNAIDGFAAGIMFSILRDASSGSDFNIGLGLMLDEKVKFLGEGITADQPLPAGETEVRFSERSSWSFVLLFSVGQ